MKRVYLSLTAVCGLMSCASQAPVGANSADSVETTAMANIMTNEATPTSTPTRGATPASDSGAAATDNVMANNTLAN